MPKNISSVSVSIETVLNKLKVDRTSDDYREVQNNIRTFFELLDRWDKEQNVTNGPNNSKIQTIECSEGGQNE